MKRIILGLAIVLAGIGSMLAPGSLGAALPRGDDVTATARCVEAGSGEPAQVEVAIDNATNGPIWVSYVHGFTSGRDLQPRFAMKKPGADHTYRVEAGDRFWVWAPWDDLRERPDDAGGALVITSTGLLAPWCDEQPSGLIGPVGGWQAGSVAGRNELAVIAGVSFGQLEAWGAYPALYAMMHPDSRALVSFDAMTCWYDRQFGDTNDAILLTLVTAVENTLWTYAPAGATYDTAVAVTYVQQIGTVRQSRDVETTAHYVPVGGQYRWFFALDAGGDIPGCP